MPLLPNVYVLVTEPIRFPITVIVIQASSGHSLSFNINVNICFNKYAHIIILRTIICW